MTSTATAATTFSPVLIHIGEFKGLTGSSPFEHYLLRYFYCTDRWPCLTWGTDAAEVTVWRARDEAVDASSQYNKR